MKHLISKQIRKERADVFGYGCYMSCSGGCSGKCTGACTGSCQNACGGGCSILCASFCHFDALGKPIGC